MTGIIGILLALVLLMYLAYRGISVLILAPAMALLAVLFEGGTPILGAYTQIFMSALGNFIVLYFPLFLLGALFGKQRSILAVVLSCAVLTYGGVSLFVVAFAVFPIAAALFREADIPKRLIPATIALGAFTFTMTALPGTPAIQNAIPMPFFGTTPFAAPLLGILSGAIMFALGNTWLSRRARLARNANEGYGQHLDALPLPDRTIREHAEGEGFDLMEIDGAMPSDRPLPAFAIALAPIVLVIALNYLFTTIIIPALDTNYLALPRYGSTSIEALRGLWSIISALVISIIVLTALNWRHIENLPQSLDSGANASVLPIFNTASQVGFGAVIASLAAFEVIRDAVLNIGAENPLISLAISVNILAGITGSASGGMSIALQTLGATYVGMAEAAGVSLELMHRVTSVATGGLDALPHNGAVITLLAICGLTHQQAYKDIFVVAVLIPIVALIVLIMLGSIFGAF